MSSYKTDADMVRPLKELAFEVTTGEQSLKLKEVWHMLDSYNADKMTAQELIERVYEETGYEVELLENDGVRLRYVVETPLGTITARATIEL